ncbi:hypothetical protein V8F20_003976 [Naviculisporaceae sp. PSN 640]
MAEQVHVQNASLLLNGSETSPQQVVYKIENLTINNHGTLNLLCDKAPSSIPTGEQPPGYASTSSLNVQAYNMENLNGEVQMSIQSTRREAEINFQNRFPVPIRSVYLKHLYGGSENVVHERTWTNLGPGETTTNPLTVTYWNGWNAPGSDHWWLEITMEDGTTFKSPNRVWLDLKEEDQKSRGPLTFFINDRCQFEVHTRNRSDTGLLWSETGRVNAMALRTASRATEPPISVSLIAMTPKLPTYEHIFDDISPGHTSSQIWPVYFLTHDTGRDWWNISFTLPDLALPLNAPDSNNRDFVNYEKDFPWTIFAGRVLSTLVLSLEPQGLVFPNEDVLELKAPMGHTKCALINIRNDFLDQDIAKLTLLHRYHDEKFYEYEFPCPIQPSETTREVRVMEFNTGLTQPWTDAWIIRVTLQDGTRWTNQNGGVNVMLRNDDSKVINTFGVDRSRFEIILKSGGEANKMHQQSLGIKSVSPSEALDVHSAMRQVEGDFEDPVVADAEEEDEFQPEKKTNGVNGHEEEE